MVLVRRRFRLVAGIVLLTAAVALGAASLFFLADAPMNARQADTASRLPIVASLAQAEASVRKEVLLEGRISSANSSTTLPTWVSSPDAPSNPCTVRERFQVHERKFAAYWREPVRQESSGMFFGPKVRVVPRGLRVELVPGLDATIENADFDTLFDHLSMPPGPLDDVPAIDWVNGFEIGERVVARGRLGRHNDGGWTINATFLGDGTASGYVEDLRILADESQHFNGAFTDFAWFVLGVATLVGAGGFPCSTEQEGWRLGTCESGSRSTR